jgi:hypothetical protein
MFFRKTQPFHLEARFLRPRRPFSVVDSKHERFEIKRNGRQILTRRIGNDTQRPRLDLRGRRIRLARFGLRRSFPSEGSRNDYRTEASSQQSEQSRFHISSPMPHGRVRRRQTGAYKDVTPVLKSQRENVRPESQLFHNGDSVRVQLSLDCR